MNNLWYISVDELQKYQEGHPAHVTDKILKGILEIFAQNNPEHPEANKQVVPIIVSDELNHIVFNDGLLGCHLIRQK
ncbi:hypothetical protein I907_gp02 [Bacillus phage Eoghan]|uniref:Uncharacterized protein n=2 Tax=Andromedavirus TaxID=1623275 RepID=M1IQH6_9CAUD|nr:hypothetical protein I907_gp02 [Bacillus phage Eoghan]YP_009592235.1 hypothetical protein FDG68_gp02 [Bacillus phage Taylor]AGE60766.1 hypothetical protein EOGHAN_2 [Bacillus phage Eoghan]AGE60920.1 hypothetical protein TAYLOR_2 [Bacillus phage Taylor]